MIVDDEDESKEMLGGDDDEEIGLRNGIDQFDATEADAFDLFGWLFNIHCPIVKIIQITNFLVLLMLIFFRMTETHHRGPNAPAYDIAAKILLIGEAGVGKTHLILRYG